jgi:hypothetical protein
MIVRITNKTRKLGWGWTCGAVQGEHGLYVPQPDKPDYVGTVKQIYEEMHNDRTLQSIKSGGTYWNYAWFYKGKRITDMLQSDGWYQFDDKYCMDDYSLRRGIVIRTED